MINKKAQGMSVNTLILIILGVVIMVVLILGFTRGWSNILPWLGGGDNIDTLQTTCSTACTTSSQYKFCSVQREVKDGINPKFKATCNDLATKQIYSSRGYGIAPCEAISCPA